MAKKTVETLTHDEAKRPNIRTAEFQSVMAKNEQSPIRLAYERRNRDLDGDDADAMDFMTFAACFNGSLNPPKPACQTPCADFDTDGDIDVNDFLTFSSCFNGSLNAPRCL